MKKIILFALLTVISVNTFAQKGRHAVGISIREIGVITSDNKGDSEEDNYNGTLGIAIKYQYGISDYFRIEPSFTYYAKSWFSDEYHTSELEPLYSIGVSIHTFFTNQKRIRPYLIVGAEYLHGEERYGDKSEYAEKTDDFNARLGIGLDYRITYNWSLQFEACYTTLLKAENINIGCTYNF